MLEDISFETSYGEQKKGSIIKVIGVGGAGNNAVQHMFKEGIVGVDFLVCNTDKMAVERNEVPTKLVFGDTGLGAGANPKEAERLAIESEQAIRDLIGSETKMLFITAGMGKGTGTGASPVVAKIAREMGILTIAVVTYPYDLEGVKSFAKADKGIEELRKYVDSLIIIQNQKIMEIYEDETLRVALGYADDVLKNAVKCIAELITLDGYQNVDFNDILTIMKDSGEAMLGLAEASGEDRIEKVVSEAMTCSLIDDANIDSAQNFLFFVRYGEGNELKVSELKKLAQEFDKYRNDDTNVIWGHAAEKDLGDKIKLSVIITNYTRKGKSKDYGATIIDNIEKDIERNITPSFSLPEERIVTPFQSQEPAQDVAPAAPSVDTTPEAPATNFGTSNPTPNNDPQPDLFGNMRPTDFHQNNVSDVLSSPIDQFPFLEQPQQPVQQAVQPAPRTATEAVVIDLSTPNNTVTLSPNHNDDIYDNDESYRELLEKPTFRRMQDMSPVQAERVEKIVSPGNAIPQASYNNSLFFSVIPSVD
jgi:cell division protein FtsZ